MWLIHRRWVTDSFPAVVEVLRAGEQLRKQMTVLRTCKVSETVISGGFAKPGSCLRALAEQNQGMCVRWVLLWGSSVNLGARFISGIIYGACGINFNTLSQSDYVLAENI